MRRTRNATVEVNCPECGAPLTVEVSPPWPGRYYPDGSVAPPEPAEIEDVTGGHEDGCSLQGLEGDSDAFYELVLATLNEEEEAARDREDASRMERERERREDWDPQED